MSKFIRSTSGWRKIVDFTEDFRSLVAFLSQKRTKHNTSLPQPHTKEKAKLNQTCKNKHANTFQVQRRWAFAGTCIEENQQLEIVDLDRRRALGGNPEGFQQPAENSSTQVWSCSPFSRTILLVCGAALSSPSHHGHQNCH